MATKNEDLSKQKEQLELEASIAESRADIIEANVRRMKAQAEYTKLRSALVRPK